MAVLDARGLQEQIKNGRFSGLYYLYGSDVAAVEQNTARLLKAIAGGEPDSITKLDGTDLDVSRLAEEAELCPMLADYNCIRIHDCNMESLREEQRKALLAVAEQTAGQTILVFDVTGFDVFGGKTGKNKKPTAKNKTLIDLIAKHGTVCCCEPKSQSQMISEITAMAKKRGCTIDRPAAVSLAGYCGAQTIQLRQEMDKLCAFADGGEITEQMVQEMVVPQLDTAVYKLTDAVLKHHAAAAMRCVDELLAMRVETSYLLAAVAGSLTDVQRAAAARLAGKTVQDVTADFSYRFGFVVENAFRTAAGEQPEHIAHCLKLLRDAEYRLHSGAVDERVLFEKTIVEMLRK